MVSQITGVLIVCSSVCSGADQRKHQSSASLALVRGIHRRPVDSPHKWPVTRKMFPFSWRHHERNKSADNTERPTIAHVQDRSYEDMLCLRYTLYMIYMTSILCMFNALKYLCIKWQVNTTLGCLCILSLAHIVDGTVAMETTLQLSRDIYKATDRIWWYYRIRHAHSQAKSDSGGRDWYFRFDEDDRIICMHLIYPLDHRNVNGCVGYIR